jgi:hypothetical protein
MWSKFEYKELLVGKKIAVSEKEYLPTVAAITRTESREGVGGGSALCGVRVRTSQTKAPIAYPIKWKPFCSHPTTHKRNHQKKPLHCQQWPSR